jgi:hypothetical protein
MSFLPKRPTGSDPFHVWAQWVHDQLTLRLRFNNSSTVKFNETTKGISATAAPPSAPGASGATAQGVPLYPVVPFGNYWVCNTKSDGTGNMIRVAKPLDLWNTISQNTIEGAVWVYTYPHNPPNWDTVAAYVPPLDPLRFVRRTATTSGIPEVQAISPRYLPGAAGQVARPIVAIPNFSTGAVVVPADTVADPLGVPTPPAGTKITWQHCGPHHWSRLANQNS